MSKSKGFDLAGFRKPAIEVEYLPHESVNPGEGLKLSINADLLTLDKMDEIEARFNAMFAPPEPEQLAEGNNAADAEKPKTALAIASPKVSLYTYEKEMLKLHVSLLVGEPGNTDPNGRFIASWNAVVDGKPVPIAYESLVSQPANLIKGLYDFVTGAANNPTKDDKKK